MPQSTLTSKGQITIPKAVRDQLGLQTGDVVHFHVREDGVVEMRAQNSDLMSLFGMLRDKADGVLTLGEIDDAIARAVNERYERSAAGAGEEAAQPVAGERPR